MFWALHLTYLCALYCGMKLVFGQGDFCDPGTPIPSDLPHCGSCINRCETKVHETDDTTVNGRKQLTQGNINVSDIGLLDIKITTGPQRYKCFCDKLCLLYGDCCKDFKEECSFDFEEADRVISKFPNYGHKYFSCVSNVLVMSTCADGVTKCQFSSGLNDDVNTFVPIYDMSRDVHYISGYCAVCNNGVDVIPWGINLSCTTQRRNHTGDVINSTEAYDEIRASSSCSIIYSKPNLGKTRGCKPSMGSTCRSDCRNEELIRKCDSSPLDYMYYLNMVEQPGELPSATPRSSKLYRNPYCVLCEQGNVNPTHELSCTPATTPPNYLLYIPKGINPDFVFIQDFEDIERFSLTMVFDFDPRKGLTIGEHRPPECAEGYIYHPAEGACRAISCPREFILKGSFCIPKLSTITVVVKSILRSQLNEQRLKETIDGKEMLEEVVFINIAGILDMYQIDHILDISSHYQVDDQVLETKTLIQCNCDYSKFFSHESNITSFMHNNPNFRKSLLRVVRDAVFYFLHGQEMEPERISSEMSVEMDNIILNNEQDCLWLIYNLHEVNIRNDSVKIVSTGKTYNQSYFELLNNSVIVCEDDLNVSNFNEIQIALGVVTLVCISISILCLIIRILLQLCVARFNTRPGKLQFHLTVAFLVAFVFLIVAPLLANYEIYCILAAGFLCYGIFASFTWMNVIAVDTWLAFRPSGAFMRSGDNEKSLLRYIVIGWGVPLVLVTIPVGIDYSNIVETYKPNFGGNRCWFTQRIAMLTYFALPIAISIILNIYFYIHTSINLHKAFSEKRSKSAKKGHHFFVYVRLFVLIGITWLFGFLSAFLSEPPIDFIFVILTSLQGLFMFVSFVCNKHVLSELRKSSKGNHPRKTNVQKKHLRELKILH